ncbi:hypothetical protein [Glycomyces arizonensis]|uniref:hypothetical protein n=1 Tax=Glycomyces arizonensis TaxID=256035 RepID=UPI0012EC4DC9|nr:hypothetical protein [Glycomyces arizonensis]
MAEPPVPEGAYIGEFRRGPAIFTVFRIAVKPDRYRVLCSDGNGPGPVCVFADEPGSEPRWHGAWNGDEWCPWIDAEARKVIARLKTRGRRRADRCRRSRPLSAAAPDHMPSPGNPQGRG